MRFSEDDLQALRQAKELLENPSLAARMTHLAGAPVERGLEMLPASWAETVRKASSAALFKALDFSVAGLGEDGSMPPADKAHRVLAAATGAAGGALGLAALSIELPVSTTIMLRSIADIARSEGEPIERMESRLACLEVFALGGRVPADDAAETGYFAVRIALARSVSEAARYLAQKGVVSESAPALVRFVVQVGARFGVVISQKAAAQMVPLIGAAGGAAVNTIFMNHFQDIAHGHFTVRRLERTHGVDEVRRWYEVL